MKKYFAYFTLAILLLFVGKANAQSFKTYTVSDKLCFMTYSEDAFDPDYDTVGVLDSFSVVWPAKDMMTDRAMRELMGHYFFSDSTNTDIRLAARNWRESVVNQYGGNPVENIDENFPYSENVMYSSCEQVGNLATFTIHYYNYEVGAAHGMYAEQYVTVDVKTGEIIHLNDLVDTTRLGVVVARAIQRLDVNSEVLDHLFDEYKDAKEMPVSLNFFIDSTHSTINVVYDLYHISPYCYGLQTVALPVSWLSKQLPLTPYAKRLFKIKK